MTNAIETFDLTRRSGRTEAVKGLKLQVPAGSVFALLGPNGAGKTTTLKLLMNLLRATRGTATEAVQGAPEPMRTVIAALQALRGIAGVSAVPIVTEVGELSRFAKPRQLMGYSGAVASEDSTGTRIRRGAITKTGNAHLRRVVIEAAWAYRHRPAIGATLRKRQAAVSSDVTAIAWNAQHRLHARYRHLLAKGKCQQEVVTAVGRELLGFIWAIGVKVEAEQPHAPSAAA